MAQKHNLTDFICFNQALFSGFISSSCKKDCKLLVNTLKKGVLILIKQQKSLIKV